MKRVAAVLLVLAAIFTTADGIATAQASRTPAWPTSAAKLLADLQVKPPASMAGYSREKFGPPWKDTDGNGCDTRNDILRLDLHTSTSQPARTV